MAWNTVFVAEDDEERDSQPCRIQWVLVDATIDTI